MQFFKQTFVNVGDIKLGQKEVKVEWEFEGMSKEDVAKYKNSSGNEVFAVAPGCGCTANLEVTDKGITALYNDGGNNIGQFTKQVVVYHAPTDDTLVRVTNEKGREMYNKKLASTTLKFMVNVTK